MRLLLDQGLPRSASDLLSNLGIDTIHVSEIGLSAAKDNEILEHARRDERIVVTLDADFHTLLALSNATSPSVIRIRIERLNSQALCQLLTTVIAECQASLRNGAAITVEHNRIRLRLLPLIEKG